MALRDLTFPDLGSLIETEAEPVGRTKNVPSTSLSNEIFHRLRNDIVMCRLDPGTKLQVDKLAERFDVSLSSVREALSRLSAEGLVVAQPQRGFWVAPVAVDDLLDITAARVEIEPICIRNSVANADAAWADELTTAYEALQALDLLDPETRRVTDTWEAQHNIFHTVLASRCASQTLMQVRRQLFERTERYRRLASIVVPRVQSVTEEHAMIYRAAMKRDGVLAAALLASHIRETAETLSQVVSRG